MAEEKTTGSYELADGTTVVDVVCPDGHEKGHIATAQFGRATCGKCGEKLVDPNLPKVPKGKRGAPTVNADEPLAQPGLPKAEADSEQKAIRAGKANPADKKGAKGKAATAAKLGSVDARGGKGVTVREDPDEGERVTPAVAKRTISKRNAPAKPATANKAKAAKSKTGKGSK